MLELKDKIAIVSGCGSIGDGFGNGRAIATLLARQGAKVIGTDINEEAGNNTSNFIKKEGNDFSFYKVIIYTAILHPLIINGTKSISW